MLAAPTDLDPRRWRALPVLLTGSFLSFLDFFIVNIALPAMHNDLRASSAQLQLVVATADGTPLASDRLPKIEMRTTNVLGSPPSTWPKLTNQMVLATNGVARLTNTISPGETRQFYRTFEQP